MTRIPFKGIPGNVQRAVINASASGDTAVVAAQGTTLKIRVLAMWFTTSLANTIKFKSGSTDITAADVFPAGGGVVLPFNEHGWFTTAVNEALNFNQTAASTTGLNILYTVTT